VQHNFGHENIIIICSKGQGANEKKTKCASLNVLAYTLATKYLLLIDYCNMSSVMCPHLRVHTVPLFIRWPLKLLSSVEQKYLFSKKGGDGRVHSIFIYFETI